MRLHQLAVTYVHTGRKPPISKKPCDQAIAQWITQMHTHHHNPLLLQPLLFCYHLLIFDLLPLFPLSHPSLPFFILIFRHQLLLACGPVQSFRGKCMCLMTSHSKHSATNTMANVPMASLIVMQSWKRKPMEWKRRYFECDALCGGIAATCSETGY